MADDVLITIGTDVKGVITAIDKTTRLENRVKKLAKALDSGRINSTQFNDSIEKIAKTAGVYSNQVDKFAKSLLSATKAQKEAAAADQKAKQEAKAFAQARAEATEANRQFDAQRKRDIAAAKEQAAEEERLRRKFIEGHAAMDLYSKELNDLAVARAADIISKEEQIRLTERLNQAKESGTGVFSSYGAAMQEATTRNNRMGVVFQQTGYQVGDFLVQIQSGTNPMVALGQQATQLAGVMTMFGGKMLVIGSILGIAIPLFTAIGAAFLRSRQEAAKAAEDVKTLDDELKSLDDTLQDWVRTKKAAEAGVTIEELIGGKGLEQAQTNLDAAIDKLEEIRKISLLPVEGASLAAAVMRRFASSEESDAIGAYLKAIERIGQIEQKQAEDQYKTFAEEAIQLKQQIALQEQILKTGEDSAEVRKLSLEQDISNYNRVIDQQVRNNELTENQGRLLKEQNEAYLRLVESGNKIALTLETALRLTQQITGVDLKGAFNQAAASVSTMNSRLDMTLDKIRGILGAIGSIGFDTIAIEAETKALRAGQSAGQASVEGQMARAEAEMRQAGPLGAIEQIGLTAQRAALEARMRAEAARQAELDKLKPASKSGGGGEKSEENQMEQFIQGLMTERETLESWRSEQLDLLQQYNDKELAIIGGQAQARYRIEKEYEDRIRALKVNSLQNTASAVSGILSGLASLQDTNNKKQFEKQKKYQTAAAIVDGIAAAVSAWEKGMKAGGPFLAAAYTAGSLLKTGGLIKQIQSAQFSGGGTTSGGGGAPSGADAAISGNAAAAPQRVIIEGIDRNSLISGEQLSNIFEALYKENENRGFVFEVAR